MAFDPHMNQQLKYGAALKSDTSQGSPTEDIARNEFIERARQQTMQSMTYYIQEISKLQARLDALDSKNLEKFLKTS